MSTILKLEILPLAISRQSWADLWDTTAKVLREWDLPLIRPGTRILADIAIPVLTSPDDGEPGYWEVFGDRNSLSYGGRFGMYRDLTHYQRSADRFGKTLFSDDSSGKGPFHTTVFDNNYKGKPYGTALVAVGMLVENAMGEDAVLRGEFDWDDVLHAKTRLKRILGRELEPPHVTSKEWVSERLGEEDLEWVYVPPKTSEPRPGYEILERWTKGYRAQCRFSEGLTNYAVETARLAEQLPNDRDRLLRLLAENLLTNTYAPLAETIDEAILRLDESELKWLVAFTREYSGCMSFRERREAFIEDSELRRELISSCLGADSQGLGSTRPRGLQL